MLCIKVKENLRAIDSSLTNVSLFIIKAQRCKPGEKESCQRKGYNFRRRAQESYVLENGKLVTEGLSSELRNNEKVKKAYIEA